MARILVVDDRAADREYLRVLLAYAGHVVVTAGDGKEGLSLARDRRPDLAIVDIVMPTMDGLEFVNNVRSSPQLAGMPVIFYSASFLRSEAEKLAVAGRVQRVLQKPAEPGEIIRIVNEVLGVAVVPPRAPKVESTDRTLLNVTINKTRRELEGISQQLAVLVELAREFTTVSDPDKLLERLGAAGRSVVGARWAVVAVLHDNREDLARLFTIGGGGSGYAEHPFPPLTTGVYAELLKACRTSRYRGIGIDARDFGMSIDADRVTAYLWTPIVVNGLAIGFLCLLNKVGGGAFSEDDARVVETLAAQAAVTHENIRLMRETERRLEIVNALRAIDVAITSSLEIVPTLDVILDQVVTHLKVTAATILLYNRGTNLLETAATKGFRNQTAASRVVKFGEGHAGVAAVERRTIGFASNATLGSEVDGGLVVGGERFEAYYAAALVSKGRTLGVLEVFNRLPLDQSAEWIGFLEALAGQSAIAIDEAEMFSDLQRANLDLVQAYDSTLEGWIHALDLRDKETVGHTERVTALTLELARSAGLSDSELVHVRRGSLLHDIGKLGIPDAILLKPGPLSDEEWVVMKRHTTLAYEWLRPIAFLRPALDIPHCHHEKWDGTGYPRGMTGEDIPFAARLFAVADVWDALTSDRIYRKALSRDEAIAHIRDLAGKHLAPDAVEIFFKLPQFCLASGGQKTS